MKIPLVTIHVRDSQVVGRRKRGQVKTEGQKGRLMEMRKGESRKGTKRRKQERKGESSEEGKKRNDERRK